METSPPKEITDLLIEWTNGDEEALGTLMPAVESELRRLAHGFLRRERRGHSLETTELVNELFVRLLGDGRAITWQGRAHFFGIAARIMRRVLVDHARKRLAGKRQGVRVTLDEAHPCATTTGPDHLDVLALHDALGRLEQLDEQQSRIVELRFFAGLSNEDIAQVLSVSKSTVKRDWRMARAWLRREIEEPG